MAGDGAVDEPMETEILPSTSGGDAKVRERDGKSANLPWYVFISATENFISIPQLPRYGFRLSFNSTLGL